MKHCLYCYQFLGENETDFHTLCSKKIFGQPVAPVVPYNEAQMEELALQVVKSQMAVTGVQPKISLGLAIGASNHEPRRLTIVGLWGGYILKPPTLNYQQLPEVEDLTMHLANIAKIKVVPHTLIRLQSGNLAYLTKRIDRDKKTKLPMEDMCQLTEKLTEDKYQGSYEQVARTILKFSSNPGLDVVNLFEQVLFSFFTGNADMHLKNFSLFRQPHIGYVLSPAYDLVATSLVNPADDEDLALTLNGKRKNVTQRDFTAAFNSLRLDSKQQSTIFKKLVNAKDKWKDFIDSSFLSDDLKSSYKNLIRDRFSRFGF